MDELNKKISVVVPVQNEEENLELLIERLNVTLKAHNYDFEIICVDDYSTDNSFNVLEQLSTTYPVKVVKKVGVIGKGTSVIEGIEKAKGDIIALIDADLAYPPESLPSLIKELDSADIVVGNRKYVNGERFVKKQLAKAFNFFFGRMLFGLQYDTQSGLKVFKKKVLDHITFDPSNWSFDLEFMLKANHAGYRIKGIDVEYTSRHKGIDKMNPFSAAIELLMMSINLKLNPLEPVVMKNAIPEKSEVRWKRKSYRPYTMLSPKESAIKTVTATQVLILLNVFMLLAIVFIDDWHFGLVAFITILSFLYFADLLFNFYLVFSSLKKSPEIQIPFEEIVATKEWPIYTIMCPLYKEWQVVPQFIKAIENMDYPKDKLQVILALEEDDAKTIETIKQMKLPEYVELSITPSGEPKTKPKACNYALYKTKGEFVVIYDAEDIPEPLQLKKAVVALRKLKREKVVCLQAKLNFYNPHQNLLTKLFSLEYSLWFDLVLTGLHSIGAPIPLGGTSNHFRRDSLQLLQGWDPFNVTEDCDLGIRLFKYGYKTKVLDSVTMEEANSSFFGWFKQRSRWIKGYIQTYLVHMRRPHEFITDWSNFHLLTFQLIVGGKVLSMWINPFLWLTTIAYFGMRAIAGPFIESLYIPIVFYIAVFSLVIGNFLYFYYYMIGAAKREQWELVKYAFMAPFYWLMMSVASWMALNQIFFKPHHWEKTQHGLHLNNKKTLSYMNNVVGSHLTPTTP